MKANKVLSAASLFLALLLPHANAIGATGDKHLSAIFSHSSFYQPGTGSYLETYISFDAWSLNFVKQEGKYQATVEILVTVSKNDTIEMAKKYELTSPKIDDTSLNHFNFIDMQRFALPNGIHNLTITLHDKNSGDSPTVVNETVALYYDRKRPALSSVQMMSDVKPTVQPNIMSRGGYDMEPYVNDFLPQQISLIHFYCELYNINLEVKDQYVYIFSYIETQETGVSVESTETVQRAERDSIIPIFGSRDISNLPSGNYNLVVEVRNHNNDKLLYKRLPFFRSNPEVSSQNIAYTVPMNFASKLNDEAKLNDYVEALYPLANEQERREIYRIIKLPGLEEKQSFLYKFWVRRDALNPEDRWNEYRLRIEYVNSNFAWINTKGYQTDRGRVYLQYGPPDYVRDEKSFVSVRGMGSGVTLVRSDDPTQRAVGLENKAASHGQVFYLPYQLWRYNRLEGDDANRCFIFWDEFRSGNYQLLNSNARGEVRDSAWERRLSGGQLPSDTRGEVGEQFERGH